MVLVLTAAIRATFLSGARIASAIAERVRCCARPNVKPVDCRDSSTKSDCAYWERIALGFISLGNRTILMDGSSLAIRVFTWTTLKVLARLIESQRD
jgi:hypothetical protein